MSKLLNAENLIKHGVHNWASACGTFTDIGNPFPSGNFLLCKKCRKPMKDCWVTVGSAVVAAWDVDGCADDAPRSACSMVCQNYRCPESPNFEKYLMGELK